MNFKTGECQLILIQLSYANRISSTLGRNTLTNGNGIFLRRNDKWCVITWRFTCTFNVLHWTVCTVHICMYPNTISKCKISQKDIVSMYSIAQCVIVLVALFGLCRESILSISCIWIELLWQPQVNWSSVEYFALLYFALDSVICRQHKISNPKFNLPIDDDNQISS